MVIHVNILYPTNGMIYLEAKNLGKNYFLSLYTGSISKTKVSGMETINEVWVIIRALNKITRNHKKKRGGS